MCTALGNHSRATLTQELLAASALCFASHPAVRAIMRCTSHAAETVSKQIPVTSKMPPELLPSPPINKHQHHHPTTTTSTTTIIVITISRNKKHCGNGKHRVPGTRQNTGTEKLIQEPEKNQCQTIGFWMILGPFSEKPIGL